MFLKGLIGSTSALGSITLFVHHTACGNSRLVQAGLLNSHTDTRTPPGSRCPHPPFLNQLLRAHRICPPDFPEVSRLPDGWDCHSILFRLLKLPLKTSLIGSTEGLSHGNINPKGRSI